MKVCLVVPYYLRGARDAFMLRRLLNSAIKQAQKFSSIIIVDDASPYLFDNKCKDVDYIRLEVNCGPATARNEGIERAQKLGSSYILFTDHDCILSSNWSMNMVGFLRNSSYEAAGGLTAAWGKTLIDRFHDVNGTLNGRLFLPERKHLLYAPTCNFAISSKVAEEFKFDSRYRQAAGEDVDFCLQISKKYPIGFCREALIWHDFGYRSTVSGISRLAAMFKKYKEANALLYQSYPQYFTNSWYKSEPISTRNQGDISYKTSSETTGIH